MIVINFKTYQQGKKALELAKTIEEIDNKAIVCIQATDIKEISERTKLRVYSQHVDSLESGRNTGHIIPEAIKASGAIGTLLNHSEHKISFNELKKAIELCRKNKLKVIVCSPKLSEIKKIIKLKPEAIAFEDEKLISTGKSITEYNPQAIIKFVKLMKNTNIIPLCGAGISTREDIKTAFDLGCKGVLIASAIAKTPEKNKIREILR